MDNYTATMIAEGQCDLAGIDESGNKVYDVQEMFEELDRKIYDLQQKEADNG